MEIFQRGIEFPKLIWPEIFSVSFLHESSSVKQILGNMQLTRLQVHIAQLFSAVLYNIFNYSVRIFLFLKENYDV